MPRNRSDADVRRIFELRATRGDHRDPESVLASAHAAAEDDHSIRVARPRSGLVVAFIATTLILVCGAVWLIVIGSDGDSVSVDTAASPVTTVTLPSATSPTSEEEWHTGPCGPPPTRPANPTDEDRAAFDASVEQSMQEAASGWIRFQSEDVVNGGWMCGWTRTPPRDPAEIAAAGFRQEVFDAIDGAVIGYAYVGVGFVPAEVADAPGFDPASIAPPVPDDLDQASADALAAQLDVERSSGRTLVSDGTDDGPGVWVDTQAFQQAGMENRQLDLPAYASATSTDPVGILTDGGVVDLATFQSPDFDVEQLILDRFGEDRLALYRKNGNHW